jgi:hypothetical protein
VLIHAKMLPVETIPGMGEWGTKENGGGVNSSMIYCKNFCKCHNVPPLSTTIKKGKKKKKDITMRGTFS